MSSSQFHTQNNNTHNQKVNVSNKSAGGPRRPGALQINGVPSGNAVSQRKLPHSLVLASASHQSQQAHFAAVGAVNRVGNGQKQAGNKQNNDQSQKQAQASLNQQLVQLQSLNNQHHLYREAQKLQQQFNNDQNIGDLQSSPSKAPIMQAPTTIINNNNINFYAAAPGQLKQQIPFFSSNQEALLKILQQNQAGSQPNIQVAKQQLRQNLQQPPKPEQRQRVSKPASTRQSKALLLPQQADALQPMEMQRQPEATSQMAPKLTTKQEAPLVGSSGQKRPAARQESNFDTKRINAAGVDASRSIKKSSGIKVQVVNESYSVIGSERQRQPNGGKQRLHIPIAQGLTKQTKPSKPLSQLGGLAEDNNNKNYSMIEQRLQSNELSQQIDLQYPERLENNAFAIDGSKKSHDPTVYQVISQPPSRPSSIKKHLPTTAFQSDNKSFRLLVSETGQRGKAASQSLQELPMVARASQKNSSIPIIESQEQRNNFDNHLSKQTASKEQDSMYASVSVSKLASSQFQQANADSYEINRVIERHQRPDTSWKPSTKMEKQALLGTSEDGGAYQSTIQKSLYSKRSLQSSSNLGVESKTELNQSAAGASMCAVGQPGKKRRQINVQKAINKQLLHQDGHKGYQQAESFKKRPKVQSQTYEIEQPSGIQQSSKFLGSAIAFVGTTSGWSPEKADPAQRDLAVLTNQEHDATHTYRQDSLNVLGNSHSGVKEFTHKSQQNSVDERQNEIYGLNQNSKKKPLLLNYPIQDMQRRGSQQGNRSLNRETMRGGNYQSAQELYLPQTVESDIRQREQNQEPQSKSLNPSPARRQARRLVPLRQQEFDRLSGNASRSSLSEHQKAQQWSSRQSSARQIQAAGMPAEEYSGQLYSVEASKHARRSSSGLRQPKHVSLQLDSSMDADLEHNQQEFPTKQATDHVLPRPSHDNFLDQDLESGHQEPSDDIGDLEQQILNMEYDPTGSADDYHHQIAEIAADLNESKGTAENRRKNWRWLIESAQELEDDEDKEVLGLKKELEKTQRLAAIQQAIYQNQ